MKRLMIAVGLLASLAFPLNSVLAARGLAPRLETEPLNWQVRRAALAFTAGQQGTDSLTRNITASIVRDTTAPFLLTKAIHYLYHGGAQTTGNFCLRFHVVGTDAANFDSTLISLQLSVNGFDWFDTGDNIVVNPTGGGDGSHTSFAVAFDSDPGSSYAAGAIFLYPWVRFSVRYPGAGVPNLLNVRAYVSYLTWEND